MADEIDIDINVNLNNIDELDELSSRLQDATSDSESLNDTLSETELDASNVDTSSISDGLDSATSDAEELQSELEEINKQLDEFKVCPYCSSDLSKENHSCQS